VKLLSLLLPVLLLANAAAAQEPPPPLLDEWIPPDEKPAEDKPAPPPADAPPPPERVEEKRPLPPADPLPPEHPFWERNPLVGTFSAGLGGGVAAGVAVGATWGVFLGFGSLNSSSASQLFATTALLLGVTAIPFFAGFGAGAALLPLSPDCSGAQLGELCESCMMGWACVGCALGGGGSGVNCSAPMNNMFGRGGGALSNRSEVYWAAVGAGLGTVAGAGAGFLAAEGTARDETEFLLALSVGAIVGAMAGGAGGGAIGTLINGWGFEEGPSSHSGNTASPKTR
jgi:hypothetical protein